MNSHLPDSDSKENVVCRSSKQTLGIVTISSLICYICATFSESCSQLIIKMDYYHKHIVPDTENF